MYALYFICPLVFLILLLIVPPLVRPDLPACISINVGVLDTQDIKKMTAEQLERLRALLRRYFFLAFAASVVISVAFVLFVSPWTPFSPFICNMLGLVMGIGCLRLTLRKAAALKQELQNTRNQG